MEEATQSSVHKTVLPPVGQGSPELEGSGQRPKTKFRPAKLKTPLDLVLSSDVGYGSSSQQRPIGTPPPTSLRKSRDHPHVSGFATDRLSSPSEDLFPQINVEKCPETHDEMSAFPALNSSSSEVNASKDQTPESSNNFKDKSTPDNQRGRLSSENNNQAGSLGSDGSPSGLTPPQRLVTRDQDGVVFELTSKELHEQSKNGDKSSVSHKPTRLDPIVK